MQSDSGEHCPQGLFQGCGKKIPALLDTAEHIDNQGTARSEHTFNGLKRLSGHQVPGLLNSYHKVYLLVEGVWRGDPISGKVQIYRGIWKDTHTGKRTFTLAGVWGYLNSLAVQAGIIVIPTTNMKSTVMTIKILKNWWSEKWESHHSLHALYKPQPPQVYVPQREHGKILLRYVAAELPGIGWQKAVLVEEKFGTVKRMVEAKESEWLEIEGIGKLTARMVYKALREA